MVNKVLQDNTWYVAIMKMGSHYWSLEGGGGESYRDFSETAKRHGVEIVAEQFQVSPEAVDRITGFDKDGKRTDEVPLKNLADKLNAGEEFNIQEALERLCAA